MFYAVTATVTKKTPEGTTTYQVPTFYLNANVQGIVDAAHAARIAYEVINPTNDPTLDPSIFTTTVYEN